MQTMSVPNYSKISPTARFVAHLRTFTDIKYSLEIAAACNAEDAFVKIVGDDAKDFTWLALPIEQRYKSVDAALRATGIRKVVELASGVSPRGIIWSRDESVQYLATDLVEIIAQKIAIEKQILGSQTQNQLRWMPLDALNPAQCQFPDFFFKRNGPIGIVVEGLLPYLNLDEKRRVAENIHALLKRLGGVWITPDISSREHIQEIMNNPQVARIIEVIPEFIERNLHANSFVSMEEARSFYADLGFEITEHSQQELVPELSSAERLNLDPRKFATMLGHGKVLVMKAV